jgi:hypothetical protein
MAKTQLGYRRKINQFRLTIASNALKFAGRDGWDSLKVCCTVAILSLFLNLSALYRYGG